VDRHTVDPVALVFGLAFVAAGAIVVSGGRLIDEGRVLVPLGLVAFGVALLFRSSPRSTTSTEPAAGTDAPADDPEADDDSPSRGHAGGGQPGAEFYLGADWRPPEGRPQSDDEEPG
jgi:hypothetical protein